MVHQVLHIILLNYQMENTVSNLLQMKNML